MADRKRQKQVLIALAILAFLVFVIWLVARLLSQPAPDNAFFEALPDDRSAVIAHRGGSQLWPENTILAFRAARNAGVDAIELDVRAASDGTPVVIHDATVDRTTEGTGEVSSMTVEQLQSFDAGYNFTSLEGETSYPYRGMGARIPTLREVFREFPGMPFILEIKSEDEALISEIGRLIAEHEREELTLIASVSAEVQQSVREMLPEVATSAVHGEIVPFLIANWLFVPGVYTPSAEAFFVPPTTGPFTVTSERFIRNAQRRNVFVGAFTVNDPPTMRTLVDRNIDAVVTDRPDLLLQVLGRL